MPLPHLREDSRAGFHQHYPKLLKFQLRISLSRQEAEIVHQVACHLDSSVVAARHHESKQATALFRVGLDGRHLQNAHQMVAEPVAIGERLERKRVMSDSGITGEILDGTYADHKMVIRQCVSPAV